MRNRYLMWSVAIDFSPLTQLTWESVAVDLTIIPGGD